MPRTSKKQTVTSKKASNSKKAISKDQKVSHEDISKNNHFNIVELILLDHTYLKDCIEVLKDEDEDDKVKFKFAKGFLDALKKHSAGEKKAIYSPLENAEDFRSQILEAQVEHGIVDSKIKYLSSQLTGMRSLTDEMEAEMKVLAEIVEHHLKEEEDELLPKMREQIDASLLNDMGFQFLLLRQFTEKDLVDSPELQEEMPFIKTASPRLVGNLLTKTQEYFGSESAH